MLGSATWRPNDIMVSSLTGGWGGQTQDNRGIPNYDKNVIHVKNMFHIILSVTLM
jgi:hypothetical protein